MRKKEICFGEADCLFILCIVTTFTQTWVFCRAAKTACIAAGFLGNPKIVIRTK